MKVQIVESNFRILHLAFDEKFVDMAFNAFELVALGCNDLCLYLKDVPKHTKTKPSLVISRIDAFRGMSRESFEKYDMVIVHSLHPAFFRSILNIPSRIPVIWLGWGYDYYDILSEDDGALLLNYTRAQFDQSRSKKSYIQKLIHFFYKISVPMKSNILKRINFFSPVLPREFLMIKNKLRENFSAEYVKWNYGTLERDLIAGIENAVINSDSILVGNSAAYTNNHLEVFELIAKLEVKQNIIVPLSYGDAENREKLLIKGVEIFGYRFKPIVDFMPINEYNLLIQSCGYVVMNHVRQQALGNIISMLYLGARIFLREECETFDFLVSEGAIISSIQDLEKNPELLKSPLSLEDRQKNRDVVYKHWSNKVSGLNTRNLINTALRFKSND